MAQSGMVINFQLSTTSSLPKRQKPTSGGLSALSKTVVLCAAAAAAVCSSAGVASITTEALAHRYRPAMEDNPFLMYAYDNLPQTSQQKCDLRRHVERKFERDAADPAVTRDMATALQNHLSNFKLVPDIARLYHETNEDDWEEATALLAAASTQENYGGTGRNMRPLSYITNNVGHVPARRFLLPQALFTQAQKELKQREALGEVDEREAEALRVLMETRMAAADGQYNASADGENASSSDCDNGSPIINGTTDEIPSFPIDATAAAKGRSFQGSAFATYDKIPVTTGACDQCTGGDFVSAALQAEDACQGPLSLLANSASATTTDLESDMAWSAFCSSDCFVKMSKIAPEQYCCLGTSAAPFLNILAMCQPSSQPGHTHRYCGAEMTNMLSVACNYSTPAECGANSRFCEWYADENVCLFRPTQENLDYVCTDCNRRYFEQFPAGGLYNYTMHAMIGGVYGVFCNKVQDEYCYLTSAEFNYTMAHSAVGTQYDQMCKNDAATRQHRLCHRIVALRTAESIRRNAQEQWKYCNASEDAYQDCDYTWAGGFLIAQALERSSMLGCSNDPSNRGGAVCAKVAKMQLDRDPCIRKVQEDLFCPSTCDYKARAAALMMGCCGPVYGQGGFDIAAESPYPTRLLIGSSPVGLGYINNQSFISTPGKTRPARTDVEYVVIQDRADRLSTANSFSSFANCSSFLLEYALWVDNQTKCVTTKSARTYRVRLHVNYNNLQNCVNRDYVYAALTADLGAVTGITRTQIKQTYITSDNETKVMMEGSRRSNAGLLMILSIVADTDDIVHDMDANILRAKAEGRFVFPTAGVEMMLNCPNVMPNSHTPIFVDMYPQNVRGETSVNGAPGCCSRWYVWIAIGLVVASILSTVF